MENEVQKKILFTYFENFGVFHPQNDVCNGIYESIHEKFGEAHIEYLKLKTNWMASCLTKESYNNLNSELSKLNYEYIISIGKCPYEKTTFEYWEGYSNCYIVSPQMSEENGFEIGVSPRLFGIGACFQVLKILVEYATTPNINCKVNFIHIPKVETTIIDFMVNVVESLLSHCK